MIRMISPIKDCIAKAMNRPSLRKKYKEQSVVHHWREIVGDEVARHVSAGKFSRGTLTVHTDSSVWSHQALMQKRDWIKKINAYIGDKIAKDIRIQTGYQAGFRELNKDLPNLDHYLKQVKIEPEVLKEIKQKTDSITDDKLKMRVHTILMKQKKLDRLKTAYGYHMCAACHSLCEKNEIYCTVCRRKNRQNHRARIQKILIDAPFLTYANLNQIYSCTNLEYQEEKADLIDRTAKKLRDGDESSMTRSLLAMLVTGMSPDVLTEESISKVVNRFRGKKYVPAPWK